MNDICKIIENKIFLITNLEALRPLPTNDSFRSIGVDSIDYVSIVMEIEEHYNIELVEADIEWHKINTIYKLAEIVNERIS
tara:strand:- start:2813 stop:3055 length:243 start_codon:yes stop_codon:yes gene_type:complete